MASASAKFAEFRGGEDDWVIYSEKLEMFFLANNIKEDEIKVANLLNLVGTDTYKILRNLCHPTIPKDKSFDSLCKLLKEHFCPQINIWRERREFYESRQEDGESMGDFYARICQLSINCNFGTNLSFVLREKFMSGVRKGSIMDRLYECKEDEKMENLKQLAIQREDMMGKSAAGGACGLNYIGNGRQTGRRHFGDGHGDAAAEHSRHIATSTNPNARWGGVPATQRATSHPRSGNSASTGATNGRRGRQVSKPLTSTTTRSSHHGVKCNVCGNLHRFPCKFKDYACSVCNRKGHLAKVCRYKKINFIKDGTRYVDSNFSVDSGGEREDPFEQPCENAYPLFSINKADKKHCDMKVNVKLNNKNFQMIFDSGSSVSCLNEFIFNKYFNNITLEKDDIVLKSYNGSIFSPLGYMFLNVLYNNKCDMLKFYVISEGGPCLLGMDFIEKFKLKLVLLNNSIEEDKKVKQQIEFLKKKYRNVFSNKLGCFKYAKVHVDLTPNATPVFLRPRPVPLAYRKMMDDEIDRMCDEGILTPVESSSWATPLVPIIKADGKLRLCSDYKSSVNRYIKEDLYPLPRIEEIFAKLHNGEHFTKLDLCQAYNQFEVTKESREILAWSTHKGIFLMNRLPFGVRIASGRFQKHIEQLFQGMDNVVVYQDDILCTGPNKQQHLETLEKVLQRLENAGLTVKPSKCEFFKESVNYLGHKISKEGLRKSEARVESILKAPPPKNLTECRALLGMCNFYHKFLPNASEILRPIYDLLKKDQSFDWNADCQQAFEQIKKIIASDTVLTHFNPNFPIALTTDASNKGISAVLSHTMPNGDERPICFISRTLLPAEKNYSTLLKEATAIHWAVGKFHQYLLGMKFTIRSDHKPLEAIFGRHKSLPKMYENRLVRMAAFLSGFNYDVVHIQGKKNFVADYLSRSPIQPSKEDLVDQRVSYVRFTETLPEWPINNKTVRERTKDDEELQKVIKYVLDDRWPMKTEGNLKSYFNIRQELFYEEGILMYGARLIIPKVLRKKLLNDLHEGHFGIVKMKTTARSLMYWPGIDAEIEKIVKSCIPCLENKQNPPKTQLTPWPLETGPWKRIHIDFLGPIKNSNFLLIIDSYSKWMEVFPMKNTTTENTIEKLRETFARYGIPETVVSDNGAQLVSYKMKQFFSNNGVKHITSPPGHQQSNGLAENGVKIFKNKLKTYLSDDRLNNDSVSSLISRFLFNYRNTKHSTTNETPAFLMLSREHRTVLSQLKAKPPMDQPALQYQAQQQQRMIRNHGGAKRAFVVGESVMVADYRTPNNRTWTFANVVKKIGRSTYLCQLREGQLWKRHANQILRRHEGEERTKSQTSPTKTSGNVALSITKCKNKKIGILPSQQPKTNLTSSKSNVESLNPHVATVADTSTTNINCEEIPSCSSPSENSVRVNDMSESMNEKVCMRPRRTSKAPTRLKDFMTDLDKIF